MVEGHAVLSENDVRAHIEKNNTDTVFSETELQSSTC